MALEQWTDPRASFRPRVTIRASGTLAFSRGAQNRFGFGTTIQQVRLAYDRADRIIVITPAIKGESDAVGLTKQANVFVVYLKHFYLRFGIAFAVPRKFELQESERYAGSYEIRLEDERGKEPADSGDAATDLAENGAAAGGESGGVSHG